MRGPTTGSRAELDGTTGAAPRGASAGAGAPLLATILAAILILGCPDQRAERVQKPEPAKRDVSGFLPGHGPDAPAWAPSAPASPPTAAGAAAPPAHAPRAASAQAPAGPGESIRGVIRLAPGAKAPPHGVLFIIARMPGGAPGPPVAVKRIADPQFPLTYELSAGDAMMPGRPLQGRVDLTVRLDADGNASTHEAGDLQGAFQDNPATAGQAGVDVSLGPPGA